ncbi:MAG: LysR substrate-binding domain-containing protein [Gammaproteobacteria bacterium]
MHFDLTDLRLFVAIAEAGSITAGAERAALSLAAASTRLRALEHQAGVQLLERGRRGVELTPAGRAMLRQARQLQRQVEALRAEMAEHAGGSKATVRMLANTAALSEWLPERLADFLKAHPGIDLALAERGSEAAVEALREERADLVVVAGHAVLDGLDARPFREDRLVLVVPCGHRLAALPSLSLADALEEDFIGLASDSALQRHLVAQAARSGSRLRVRAHVQDATAVCRMVARGAGIAVLPQAAVGRSAARGELATVRLVDAWAPRQLWVVTRLQDRGQAPVERLRDWLVG